MSESKADLERDLREFSKAAASLRQEIGKVIIGQDAVIESVLIGLFAGGHILLEGVPGLGKTLLVRTLAAALDLEFSRIQFTPDLMPADITGTNIVVEDQRGHRNFQFQKGPIFGNVVLADEINRATPKTQSALLEAMQEGTVTVSGHRHLLPQPFYVLATQNPIEMEGTYPLPEAQLDRFLMKVLVGFPSKSDLLRVMDETTGTTSHAAAAVLDAAGVICHRELARKVLVAPPVAECAAALVYATHPEGTDAGPAVKRFVRYGSSPRGGQSLLLAAKVRALMADRVHVSYKDLFAVAKPALRHRLILNFEAEAEGRSADSILDEVIAGFERTRRD